MVVEVRIFENQVDNYELCEGLLVHKQVRLENGRIFFRLVRRRLYHIIKEGEEK